MDIERHVLITGVSTGIGYALAEQFTKTGYHVFGSVRKQEDASHLKEKWTDKFTPLLFDVIDEAGIAKAAQQVKEALKGRTLSALINNAGVAWPAPFLHQSVTDFQKIITTNLMGTFMVTQLGTDLSLKGKPGRVLNITSVGGKYGAPFMSAYSASKHAIEGMSESLRRELMPYGIDVIIFGPGSVMTPIWDKAQQADVSAYQNTVYAEPLQKFVNHMVHEGKTSTHDPDYMATAIISALESKSPWTRYAVVSKRLMNWTLPLSLPTRWVDKAMADTFGMKLLKREAI